VYREPFGLGFKRKMRVLRVLLCCYVLKSKTVAMEGEMKSKIVAKKKIRSGLSRVYSGSGSIRWVDRVLPGQIPSCFLLRSGSDRPGPGLILWAGPGFKTMVVYE